MCEHATDSPYGGAAAALRIALLLDANPVGVRILTDPAEVARFGHLRPSGPLTYCAAVRHAADGASFLLDTESLSCDTAPRVLGLQPGFFDDDFIGSYVEGGLYRDRDVADTVLSAVPILASSRAVLIRPLEDFDADLTPHVAIVAVTPRGVMRLTQAAAFNGHRVRSEAIGMHGICAECTAMPHITGQLCSSFLCSGTRHAAAWDDHHLAVGIPEPLLHEVVEGLMESVGRYEPAHRKERMRAACARLMPDQTDASGVGGIGSGPAYFERP